MLDELERNEVENECFLVEHNNHHVFPEFDVHDQLVGVERDLSPVLFFVIIPNNHFVPLLFVNQHDHIGFIHHFDQSYVCAKVLNLLFGTRST